MEPYHIWSTSGPEKDCLDDIDWRFDNLTESRHQSEGINYLCNVTVQIPWSMMW